LLVLAFAAFVARPAAALDIDWVDVGDPGNACDTQSQGCFGSVGYSYRIGSTEVTNEQYTEFLNAVAAADPGGLYDSAMGTALGGITQGGSSGSFTYSAVAGRESRPVEFVSVYDGLRFANWLHNGQPVGAQNNATTEDGAYTITAMGIDDNTITRNAGATIFLPNEDEWYKAAYYDAISTSYFDYPTGTDTVTTCAVPGAAPNTAACASATATKVDVGSYTESDSPSGTFDQGGNVWEWNETVIDGSSRGLRGGASTFSVNALEAAFRSSQDPTVNSLNFGFRVASVPEPRVGLLLSAALLGIGATRRSGTGRSIPTRRTS
jgi:formylglycine-generating enzyme required for sulfatase activity